MTLRRPLVDLRHILEHNLPIANRFVEIFDRSHQAGCGWRFLDKLLPRSTFDDQSVPLTPHIVEVVEPLSIVESHECLCVFRSQVRICNEIIDYLMRQVRQG